ncbi:hypothetical protein WOLCODRAFT_77984, partial [Wolfiporia cocos MD-104 SS10]
VSALWMLSTTNITCNIIINTLAFVDHSDSGRPFFFLADSQQLPINVASIATCTASLILADAFLLYRCEVIWQRLRVTLPLGLLYIMSVVLAVIECFYVTRGGGNIWTGSTSGGPFLPYVAFTGCLHIAFTTFILGRLSFYLRYLPETVMAQNNLNFSGTIPLTVESALPYAVVSFIWMILSCTGSVGANPFVPLLVQLQGITTGLIVIRIANDSAWSLTFLQVAAQKSRTGLDRPTWLRKSFR